MNPGNLSHSGVGFLGIPIESSSLDALGTKRRRQVSLLIESSKVNLTASLSLRSSSRTIKRRKFDDELVETTFNLQPPTTSGKSGSRSRIVSVSTGPSDVVTTQSLPSPVPIPATITQPERCNRRHSRPGGSNGAGRKNKKNKNHAHAINATKDLGRWKPTDDLALITGVQQTNDLRMVKVFYLLLLLSIINCHNYC